MTPVILLAAIATAVCAITLTTYEHFSKPTRVVVVSRFCPSVEFRPMAGAGFGGRSVEP